MPELTIEQSAPADIYERITCCRACGEDELTQVLDLGTTTLADRLLRPEQLDEPEPAVPLTLVLCRKCGLVQIRETVEPEILFGEEYPYFSSVSPALMRHSKENATELIDRKRLNGESLVVELASNDGYMLQHFVAAGVPVLGIDPAGPPARAAIRKGIPTMNTFFTRDLAEALARQGKHADIVIANNVLAHVRDLSGFVAGIRTILKEDGWAVIEMPYLVNLIEHGEFDTIYHQHLCYFSVTALDRLFRKHGMILADVRQIAIHGGSLRLFVQHQGEQSAEVKRLLEAESTLGVTEPEYYQSFVNDVMTARDRLLMLLHNLKAQGARIAGYAAAAKATTMLSYCGIGSNFLEYIVDLNEFKQGRFMNGCRLPIYSPERLREDPVDYVLILAWNFSKEIIQQQSAFQQAGGRFIIPVPQLKVI